MVDQWTSSIWTNSHGIFVPFIMGYGACILFGVDNMMALFVGLGLSITSIAVNARVLLDMRLQKFRITPVIIGASIVDDVLALALFSLLIGLAEGGGSFDWLGLSIIFLKDAIAIFDSFLTVVRSGRTCSARHTDTCMYSDTSVLNVFFRTRHLAHEIHETARNKKTFVGLFSWYFVCFVGKRVRN